MHRRVSLADEQRFINETIGPFFRWGVAAGGTDDRDTEWIQSGKDLFRSGIYRAHVLVALTRAKHYCA